MLNENFTYSHTVKVVNIYVYYSGPTSPFLKKKITQQHYGELYLFSLFTSPCEFLQYLTLFTSQFLLQNVPLALFSYMFVFRLAFISQACHHDRLGIHTCLLHCNILYVCHRSKKIDVINVSAVLA